MLQEEVFQSTIEKFVEPVLFTTDKEGYLSVTNIIEKVML